MALDSAAWISDLTDLKLQLGITDTSQDSFLTSLANRAYKILESYLGRVIKAADYVEYYDGAGLGNEPWPGNADVHAGQILLNQFPIISVTSVYDDLDRNFTASFLVAATDYVLYKERGIIRLYRNESLFQKGVQNLKVTYRAGYEIVPGDLVDALIQMIEHMYNRARTGGMLSQSLGGKSETYDNSRIPEQVKRVLANYRIYCRAGMSTT